LGAGMPLVNSICNLIVTEHVVTYFVVAETSGNILHSTTFWQKRLVTYFSVAGTSCNVIVTEASCNITHCDRNVL